MFIKLRRGFYAIFIYLYFTERHFVVILGTYQNFIQSNYPKLTVKDNPETVPYLAIKWHLFNSVNTVNHTVNIV